METGTGVPRPMGAAVRTTGLSPVLRVMKRVIRNKTINTAIIRKINNAFFLLGNS